jgi:hypothetical protein
MSQRGCSRRLRCPWRINPNAFTYRGSSASRSPDRHRLCSGRVKLTNGPWAPMSWPSCWHRYSLNCSSRMRHWETPTRAFPTRVPADGPADCGQPCSASDRIDGKGILGECLSLGSPVVVRAALEILEDNISSNVGVVGRDLIQVGIRFAPHLPPVGRPLRRRLRIQASLRERAKAYIPSCDARMRESQSGKRPWQRVGRHRWEAGWRSQHPAYSNAMQKLTDDLFYIHCFLFSFSPFRYTSN